MILPCVGGTWQPFIFFHTFEKKVNSFLKSRITRSWFPIQSISIMWYLSPFDRFVIKMLDEFCKRNESMCQEFLTTGRSQAWRLPSYGRWDVYLYQAKVNIQKILVLIVDIDFFVYCNYTSSRCMCLLLCLRYISQISHTDISWKKNQDIIFNKQCSI